MKIILAAIVGTEEAVIERFIRSFAPAVDEFVIVQAIGNSGGDATLEKAKEICHELKKVIYTTKYDNAIPMPHVDNFGAARQKAWEIAASLSRGEPLYLLWSDADDVLADGAAEAIRNAAESASHDVFLMPYHVKGDKQIVMRERMVRAEFGSKWDHAIHEQLTFPKDATYRIIKDAVFLHQPLSTKTGSHDRNVAILQNELRDTPRNLFYLSQEYFQSGDEKHFKAYAHAALAMPGIEDIERYEILLNLAQTNGEDSKRHAAEAFALMPDRREALALLCSYALIDGDEKKALQLARRLIKTPHPTVSYWSQNNEWYGWKGDELYLQCLRRNELHTDATLFEETRKNENRHTFSIIHATLDRPDKALQIRELWLSRARCPENVEYIFGIHSWDERSRKYLSGFKHTVTDKKGAAWNYDTAAAASTGTIIIQAQDDCYPPDGWDDALLEIVATPFHPVFVATNDGHRNDKLSVNTIMTRAYMDIKAKRDPGEAGFFHRGYTTVYPDTENSFRAIQDAKNGVCQYRDARDFILYHDHPAYNPGVPVDDTYRWENLPENYETGRKLFYERNPDATPGCLNRESEVAA